VTKNKIFYFSWTLKVKICSKNQKHFWNGHDCRHYSPKVISTSNTKWSIVAMNHEVTFKMCITNPCWLSRESNCYSQNILFTSHDISHANLYHTMLLTLKLSGLQDQVGLPQVINMRSHTWFKTLYSTEIWVDFFLHQLLSSYFCSIYLECHWVPLLFLTTKLWFFPTLL
jgi:hypothetical protein